MVGSGAGWETGGAEIRGWDSREQSAAFRVRGSGHRSFALNPSRRNAMAFAVGFVDQAEQVVIVDVLDLVGENHELAIDFIEFAALEVISELIAAQAEGVASGVLAENPLRIRDYDRLRGLDFHRQ